MARAEIWAPDSSERGVNAKEPLIYSGRITRTMAEI
jgi:hypothetical protein